MSIWASWGDEVRVVRYQFSNHYPSERDERLTLDFAHIPKHLNREYRRQRWLRVIVDDGVGLTFCINVREAKKLRDVLARFVDQPEWGL